MLVQNFAKKSVVREVTRPYDSKNHPGNDTMMRTASLAMTKTKGIARINTGSIDGSGSGSGSGDHVGGMI